VKEHMQREAPNRKDRRLRDVENIIYDARWGLSLVILVDWLEGVFRPARRMTDSIGVTRMAIKKSTCPKASSPSYQNEDITTDCCWRRPLSLNGWFLMLCWGKGEDDHDIRPK